MAENQHTPTQSVRQNYTRMYVFDEVVAVGFNTLCYDAERRGIKTSARIKKFMQKNYSILRDNDMEIKAVYKLKDGRNPVVYILSREYSGHAHWIEILSPVGNIHPDNLDRALLYTDENTVCGGLVKKSEKYLLRYCIPLQNVSLAEFDLLIACVAANADRFSQDFTGRKPLEQLSLSKKLFQFFDLKKTRSR